MEITTLPMSQDVSSVPYVVESQGSSLTSYIMIGVGVCVSIPVVVCVFIVLVRQRRRAGYTDLEKTWVSIKTASPRESESHDVTVFFESSADSDTERSSGDDDSVKFYISSDSEEELTSHGLIKKSFYLPAKVHSICTEKHPLLPVVSL